VHYYGRSDILDELFEQAENPEDPVQYDVFKLSREIMLRSGDREIEWVNETARITLRKELKNKIDCYELFVREANDTDIHYYAFNHMSSNIRYEYPLGTWHPKQKAAESKEQLEKLLLAGPVPDKVIDNRIENYIQRIFIPFAGKVVMANLAEISPLYRTEMYSEYILAKDDATKKEIIEQMYETVIAIGTFTVGKAQFENAFHSDLSIFRTNQGKLTEKAENAE